MQIPALNHMLIKKYGMIFCLAALCFILTRTWAIAQNLPSADQPGVQGSRFKTESEQEKKRIEKKKVKAPQIELEKEKEKPAVEKGPSFVLKNVKITGSTIFEPHVFRPSYERYIGKPVSFADLEDIAAGIKGIYKKKGYLSTDAYVPEQDVRQGEVEIRVVEGKMGEVKVEGNKWFSAALIKKYINIKKNDLLNIFTLQRDMIRLNQNPDMEVTAVVSAGKEPASTDIVLKVKDSIPYHAGAGFDNQGTRLVGKSRTSFSARSTNFSGLLDSVSFNTMVSKDSSGNFVSYALPVDTYGTRLGFDLAYFKMKLGREYRDLDVTGKTRSLTPHITKELYLAQDFQAYADAGIDVKDIKRKQAGQITTDDQLRMPYAVFDLAKSDSFMGGGQTFFSPRFSFGTKHFLGASSRGHPSASRPDTGGFFFKYEQTLRRIQRAAWGSYVSLRSQFLTASHTLPSSEQLQLGGANSVRGYPEGEYLADIGGTLNAEWAFTAAIKPVQKYLYPVVFADMGAGKLKNVGTDEKRHRFLMGAGFGLRIQIDRYFSLRMDWAKRLGDRPTQGQGPSTFYVTAQCEI